ncbi:histidine kinase [Dyella sp. 20L07]|uniref:sensor histidine kinase n=1 Tax=Dyella sp. 20L07 TaxID=3384240 RepID=UPI003D28C0C1
MRIAVTDAPGVSSSILWGSLLFAGSMVVQVVSVLLWKPAGGVPVIWFTGALLYAALLTAQVRLWPACVLGFVVGLTTLAAFNDVGALGAFLLASSVGLLCVTSVWLLLRTSGHGKLINRWHCLFGFIAFGLVALPLASAALISWLSPYVGAAAGSVGDWKNIALSHALGYALLVPAWSTIVLRRSIDLRDQSFVSLDAAIFCISLALIWLAWRWLGDITALQPVLILIPAPLIVWAAQRYHLAGSCAVMLAVGLIAIHVSESNRGPFATDDIRSTVLIVQVWILIVAGLALLLGQAMEELSTIRRALAGSQLEIRSLVGKLVKTQEDERARIARDLHDDVNQRLASASIQLSMLKRKTPEHGREGIVRLQQQLYDLSDAIRQLSHELHPSMLKQTGLADALQHLCATQRSTSGPSIIVCVRGQTDALPEDVALGLYRVAQEALSNAIRHAFAKRITIDLDVEADAVNLAIEDDGRGFQARYEGIGKSRGLGLVSIDDRTRLLAGEFVIHTGIGMGTRICIRIPLHERSEQRLHA